MLAMEQWDYSRFAVFRELEIRWMTKKIEDKCPEMNDAILDQGLVICLNIGSSHLTLKDRRPKNTPKHKYLTMIKSLNKNNKRVQEAWEWMEAWYVLNQQKKSAIEFEDWFSNQLDRISEWEKNWPSVFPDAANPLFNENFPFLHQGRAFPIDTAGTEIQKTLRLVPNAHKVANAWGYVLKNLEPEIPFDPFPYYPPLVDPDWYRWFLSQDFIHDELSFIGGPTGLVDYAYEMREAEKILRMPKRKESPMSKIVLKV